MDKLLNIYDLSRDFWDFAFEETAKVKPAHIAIYFFAVEHCNRLGWKQTFGLPASMVVDAIGIKSYSAYKKHFDDLVYWGFFEVKEYSKNQYSSNIIALKKKEKASTKALDKALIKHTSKQHQSTSESTVQSIDSIDKQIYNNTSIQSTSIQDTKTDPFSFENLKDQIIEVVEYLNSKTSTSFSPTSKQCKSLIPARLKEGFSIEDILSVIDHKVAVWGQDAKMKEYLRPQTLFGSKFEGYLQASKITIQVGTSKIEKAVNDRGDAINYFNNKHAQ